MRKVVATVHWLLDLVGLNRHNDLLLYSYGCNGKAGVFDGDVVAVAASRNLAMYWVVELKLVTRIFKGNID